MAKRTAKRAKAEAELKVATEADDKTDVDKFSKRLVRVTRDHNEDCKRLLSLMGVPVVTVSVLNILRVFCRSRRGYLDCLGAKYACLASLVPGLKQ